MTLASDSGFSCHTTLNLVDSEYIETFIIKIKHKTNFILYLLGLGWVHICSFARLRVVVKPGAVGPVCDDIDIILCKGLANGLSEGYFWPELNCFSPERRLQIVPLKAGAFIGRPVFRGVTQ